MNLLKKQGLGYLSHDVLFHENDKFLDKIQESDYEVNYVVNKPYPVESPIYVSHKKDLNSFGNTSFSADYFKKLRRQFSSFDNVLTEEHVRNSSNMFLPNFLLEYINNGCPENIQDVGLNVLFSFNVLETFDFQNRSYFLRPDINNDIVRSDSEFMLDRATLKWNSKEPILDIQNIQENYNGSFLIRNRNFINLVEFQEDSSIKINLKLSSDKGYWDCNLNKNKNELCVLDLKNQIKVIDLTTKKIKNAYDSNFLVSHLPKISRFKYLTENSILVLLDDGLKIVDFRTDDIAQNFKVVKQPCDFLLNFVLNNYDVHISSKHCYFIHDIRKSICDEFIGHNLKSPPCFIDYIKNSGDFFTLLMGHSPDEKAIFGKSSTYSLPFHPSSLEDTYKSCIKTFNTPLVPYIEERIKLPVRGVKLLPLNSGISIFYVNILGEIFQQNIGSDESIEDNNTKKMYEWLLDISENEETPLNAVHFANASSAFNFDCPVDHLELCEVYEQNDLSKFFESDKFDFSKYDVETFEEIWNSNIVEDVNNLGSENPENKVASWIQEHEFSKNNESDINDL